MKRNLVNFDITISNIKCLPIRTYVINYIRLPNTVLCKVETSPNESYNQSKYNFPRFDYHGGLSAIIAVFRDRFCNHSETAL